MVKESVKHLNPYVPEQTLADLKSQYGLKKLVRLSANENAFGTSPEVAKRWINGILAMLIYILTAMQRFCENRLQTVLGLMRIICFLATGWMK